MSVDIAAQLREHQQVFDGLHEMLPQIETVTARCIEVLQAKGKILLAGNGGSAADAQHIAAELTGRYMRSRQGLPAIALTTDTSALTAIGNDFGFDQVFARQVEALAAPKDVLLVYSTSGNSANILAAVERAKQLSCYTVALTGASGGALKDLVDECLCVPSSMTPRIQEAHAFIGHALCDGIDAAFTS